MDIIWAGVGVIALVAFIASAKLASNRRKRGEAEASGADGGCGAEYAGCGADGRAKKGGFGNDTSDAVGDTIGGDAGCGGAGCGGGCGGGD